MNPLESSGKPLFFSVRNPDDCELTAPADRKGVALRTAARSLSLMQKEALISSSSTNATWRVASDEGAYLTGDDAAPCPLAHMTTGMVASFMEAILALAKQRGIELGNIRLVQDNYYTMEGSALRGTMTGGALPVELSLEADSPSGDDVLLQLMQEATDLAPVHGLIKNILNSRFTLIHNGREITTGRVLPIGRPSEPLSDFDSAQAADGDWSRLVERSGMSPKTDEVTGGAGSSYAEEQSRRLHVGGICTLRPDGMKAIEQQLLNPHGSTFHFLSEEGPQAGGQSRAPDAMSYVSAGIAFCFMTQFGRYAKIAKKDLKSYSIVQDTHFSTGLAGTPGSADPVETHVHLETSEDDDFARTALDMSERTCFLHALCRSPVTLNCKVTRASAQVG